MRNPFGVVRLDGHPPVETSHDNVLGGRWRSVRIRKRITIRGAALCEGGLTRVPPIVIRREHGRVPEREDVFENGFIRLPRAGALTSRVEPSPQHVALRFRTFQALGENVAVPAALFKFGAKTSAARQLRNEITNEPPEPGH
jgi:hypothetical protein